MVDDLIARLRDAGYVLVSPGMRKLAHEAAARITTLPAERDALRRERVDKARAWDACIAARKDERAKALKEAAKACEAVYGGALEALSRAQEGSIAAVAIKGNVAAARHCVQAIRALASDPLLDRQGDGDLPTAMDIAIGVGEEAYARTGVTPAMRELMALYKKNQKGHPPACCCAECAKDWMDDGKEGV